MTDQLSVSRGGSSYAYLVTAAMRTELGGECHRTSEEEKGVQSIEHNG